MKKTVFILFVIVCSVVAQSVGSFLEKGNEEYGAGNFNAAVKNYYKAIDLGENPTLAYFNLGNAYYQMDSTSKAIVNYRSAILESPEFYRGYVNLGILYYNLRDLAAAISVLEQARRLQDEDPQVQLVLSACYRELVEFGAGSVFAEKALKNNSKLHDAYFLLSDIAQQTGDLHEAREWLNYYPDNGNRVVDKYQMLAELTETIAGPDSSTWYYYQLVDIDSDNKWSWYRLARNLEATGNDLTALRQAEIALQKFPDFGSLAMLAANIAFQKNILNKAEKYYTVAVNNGSSSGLVGLQNLQKMYTAYGETEALQRVNDILLKMQ